MGPFVKVLPGQTHWTSRLAYQKRAYAAVWSSLASTSFHPILLDAMGLLANANLFMMVSWFNKYNPRILDILSNSLYLSFNPLSPLSKRSR